MTNTPQANEFTVSSPKGTFTFSDKGQALRFAARVGGTVSTILFGQPVDLSN